jgi:hypothetical protein
MECPACHISNQPGQKFCGACGYRLEKDCAQCGATNPPGYHFCGQCGHNLATSGSIALMRSGLIAEIDQKAAALLGTPMEEMAGKPFTLFVAREDLAVFFSHWNELLGTGEKQIVELALKHKKGKKIYVQIECTFDKSSAIQNQLIHLSLNDVSDGRLALDQLQHQQDLLHLIYTLADNLRTGSGHHLEPAITDALKKICLFTKADRCFIYSIDRDRTRLEICHQWCQPSCSNAGIKSKTVPLAMIKRSIVRLRREHAYVIGNVSKLSPSERYELLAWHHTDLGAVVCHLIYARGRPIGIIGIAKNQSEGEWHPDCIALVKLFGQIVSDMLPLVAGKNNFAVPAKRPGADNLRRSKIPKAGTPAALQGGDTARLTGSKNSLPPEGTNGPGQNAPPAVLKTVPDMGRPMLLEKMTGDRPLDQQTVFPRDDGLILLTCPHCGTQESVFMAQFEKFGNAIQIQCSCHKRFAAVLEKRRSYRKTVQLEGYFTIADEVGPNAAKGSIWGLMAVKNLSKTGIRFYSKRIDLIRPGDNLMVRFNLDNSNKALIHKKVEVISIHGHEVGCRFKGADQYDITLGFYFI